MENLDVQLIHRILSGDNEAFSTLVEKYQKGIHALAWREVGDFHFAEEITQDVFLQIYKKLATLKNPNQFSGWVYVITKNLCKNWRKRNTFYMQSLEETPVEEVEKLSYTNYVLEQRETRATEHRYAIVEKLLKKLPESERTVVTLYYLGEMTPNEISRFLGVSVNTINSRIRRARKRLQEKEEFLIHGILSSIKITTDLKKNVMEQVAEMKPTLPPTMKPLFPWTALGTTMVLVMLALGAGNQYLTYFQKPYSFHAQSEPTVEIVDASIILDIDTKLSPQNQTGILVPQRKSTKITTDLKKNVMEQVAEMKPTLPPTMKPLFPWIAFGTTMVLVMLALGAGNQYLTYFQKPYSFHAQSEPTVEIVDASIILDIDTKLSLQNQTGILVPQRKSTGTDKPSDAETVSVSAPEQARFFGLTRAKIKEKIPELEEEIRTDLTKAVELYKELKTTDGMADMTPELAEWRDKTWKEVKQLFHKIADTRKIMTYTSYLKVVGENQNPTLPGGWIYELIEPLPMRITYGESYENP